MGKIILTVLVAASFAVIDYGPLVHSAAEGLGYAFSALLQYGVHIAFWVIALLLFFGLLEWAMRPRGCQRPDSPKTFPRTVTGRQQWLSAYLEVNPDATPREIAREARVSERTVHWDMAQLGKAFIQEDGPFGRGKE